MNSSVRWAILGFVALVVAIAIVLSSSKRTSLGNPAAGNVADQSNNKSASDVVKDSRQDQSDSGSEITKSTKSNRKNRVRELSEAEVQYLTKRCQILESIQGLMKEGLNTRHPAVNSKIKELSQIRDRELTVYLGEPDIEAMGTRSKEVLTAIEDELEVLERFGIEPSSSKR